LEADALAGVVESVRREGRSEQEANCTVWAGVQVRATGPVKPPVGVTRRA